TSNCSWDGPVRPKDTARIGAEELRLRSGFARLIFDGGSELLIEGPAELRVDGASEATLRSGKVVFRGDDTGPPFQLHTPTATLVDVGTAYGVNVTEAGEEIHGFNGEVRRTPQGGGSAERVSAGEGRQWDFPAAGQPATYDETKFVRQIPGGDRADPNSGLLAHEDFNYDDPDVMTKGWASGGRGWAGPWVGAPVFGFKPGQKPAPRPPA